MRTFLRVAGSLVLSAGFLALAARGVEWDEVRRAMTEVRLVFVVPMILATIASVWFRALRWGLFVRAVVPVRHLSLVSATAIGFAANMLLPLRAGEVVRPWVLSRRERIPLAPALATVALERVFDMGALLVLFAAAILTLPVPEEWRDAGWFFAGSFLALVVVLVVMRNRPVLVLGVVGGLTRRFPAGFREKSLAIVRSFADGLHSLGSWTTIAAAVAGSAAVWLSVAASFGFGLSALDLDVPWVPAAMATTLFVAIAVSIPGGPGFIGMFQAGCVIALRIYEIPASQAFGYSVVTHLTQFAGTVAFGLVFFLREGMSIGEIGAASVEPTDGSAAV